MEEEFLNSNPKTMKKFLNWIFAHANNGVERLVYDKPVRSVFEAIEVSGMKKSDFIKSICMKHKNEDLFVIAIILSGSKVDKKKLQEGIGPKKWRMATPEQIYEKIGFPAGGVPPVCLSPEIAVYVDPRVLQRKFVVGGGGTQSSLIKLPPYLIVDSGAEEKIISIG